MPTVTITGASGAMVATSIQVTTASTAAIAQAAADSISTLTAAGGGFGQANINAGVTTTVPVVGSLGGSTFANYDTLTANAIPNNVQSLVINNSGNTTASNSRFIGSETVLSGSGNLSFTDNGSSTSIVTGGGVNAITFSAFSANGSFTGDGANTIAINSANGATSVFGTSGSSDTINGVASVGGKSSSLVYTAAAGSTAFINPRASNVTVFGANGAGSTTVFGGSPNAFTGTLNVTNGSGLFQGGTAGNNFLGSSTVGGTTLMGGGSGDLLQARGLGDSLMAGAGSSTLDGSFSVGGDTLSGSSTGASLIYASKTQGDVILTTNSTVQGIGYVGEFIDLHTGPNSLLRSLNANVPSTIYGGAAGSAGATGANFASVGDFISGVDKLLLSTVLGASTLVTGTLAGAGGQPLAYSQVTTTNGSNFIFYNTILTAGDIITTK